MSLIRLQFIIVIIILFTPVASLSQTLYGVWTDLDGSSVKPGSTRLPSF